MNMSKMSPEDPKLTAYALGELDGDESALVANAIRNNPAALAAVQEIQALAGKLESALADEPIEPLAPAEVEAEAAAPGKIIRFPFYAVSGLAAACLALVFVLRPQPVKEGPLSAPTATSVVQTSPAAAAPAPVEAAALPIAEEEIVGVNVAKARRVLSDSLPDINPSPAIEGGLKLGRTVAAVDAVPVQAAPASFPGENVSELMAFGVESKLPLVDVGGKIEIPLADLNSLAVKSVPDFKLATTTFSQPKKDAAVKSVASYDKLVNWAQTKDGKDDAKSAVAARNDDSDETAKKVKAAVE